MKKQIIFMIVCLSVAILFGCQPTPEGPGPVAGHTSQADPGADALVWKDVPATCTTTAALPDGIKLVIDADVMVPEVPLCKGSIQRIPFDMTMVEQVADVLFGNAPIYEYVETKQELMEYIATVNMQIEAAKDMLDESDIAFYRSIIDNMEQAIPSRPDAEKAASLQRIFSYDNGFIKVDTGKNRKASFQALSDEHRQILSFMDLGFKRHLIDDIPPLEITEEEAIVQAEGVLDALGLGDSFCVVKTGVWPVNHTIVDQSLEKKGYVFPSRHERRYVTFMRKIGNADQVYSEQIQRGATEGAYDAAVFWELMELQFDNDGLVSFHWQEPGQVTVTEEQVSVIDLDAACAAMLAHMQASQNKYTYEPYGIPSEAITIHVDRIQLGMSCIVGKNGAIEAVPVWEFYGEMEYKDENGNVSFVDTVNHGLSTESRGCNSVCTIHAITGDVIDRGRGY